MDRARLVYRWDLDKTYLRTEFDTMRDLLRTAFESATQKRTVPGAAVLLRELAATGPLGIYIVSGSPEQLRRVLEAKLRLDGVRWDGFTLKPQLENIFRGRFRVLKDQVGYKLGALLESRAELPAEIHELMFGDDAEADAFIYSLYSDLIARRVGADTLMAVLRRAGVYEDQIPHIVRLADRLPRDEGTRRIFIHLDRVSSPTVFSEFGSRVCPFYNYFQPALVMLELGAIDAAATLRVGSELVIHHGFTSDALTASYTDLNARGQIGSGAATALIEALETMHESQLVTTAPVLRAFGRELEATLSELLEPGPYEPPEVDYVGLFAKDKARARLAKRRLRRR